MCVPTAVLRELLKNVARSSHSSPVPSVPDPRKLPGIPCEDPGMAGANYKRS